MISTPRKMEGEQRKLLVQQNGAVVSEVRGNGFVRQGFARDLRYRLEYKSVQGWHAIGWFEDDITARQVLRESNPRIIWRLVAHNEDGEVALPKGWKGYVG